MPLSHLQEGAGSVLAERATQGEPVAGGEARPLWRHCAVEFLGRGGLIHYAYQFCRGLAAQGVAVTLVTERDYELRELPHNFGVEPLLRLWNTRPEGAVEWSSSLKGRVSRLLRRTSRALIYYREWLRLVSYLGRTRPEVVQFGEIRFATDLLPLMWLRLRGFRLMDVCHNVAPFDIRPDSTTLVKASGFNRALFRRIYSCFDDIFVHSEVNRREFLRLYAGDPQRVHVIPHGNERMFVQDGATTGAESELRKALSALPEGAPVVLFFGTLTKYKGVEYLIEAFAAVRRTLPEARLVIAGYPNPDVDVTLLRERAHALGMAEAILFHLQYVPIEDVAALFERASVVVFPYLMIYQSGALQVAYSFARPVVATDVGGLSEAVADGETGLLVPPRDAASLSRALVALLTDEARARRMGERARELSETVYSWDGIGRRVVAALRDEDRPGAARGGAGGKE